MTFFYMALWTKQEQNHIVEEEVVLNEAECQGYSEDKLVFLHAVTVVMASIAKSSCVPAVQ